MKMKAAWYDQRGAAREVLKVGEMEAPIAMPGEVLVRVHATGINPSDTKSRMGAGARPNPWPLIIPHQDGAGVIEEVGEGLDPARVGERVWIYEAQLGRPFGCAAEYVAVPAKNAVPLPQEVSFEEGACLGVPALTAQRCVFADGSVEGRTVLVTGGAGAVGNYAIQFAKLGGAQVIATVSREEQAKVARNAGADHIINRREENVAGRISEITGSKDGRGVDRIVDVAFGANLETSLKVLKTRGVIASYASDEVPVPPLPFWPLAGLDATVRFVLVYVMGESAHREAIQATDDALRAGKLKHNIGARFTLDRIVEAHEALETGRTVGKIVVTVS
ncbi:NADPH:quinone reductase [Microvirga lenta]|uniref:NADPH:quinone reductase n=1 Tax=Microvirga lenta TaxID=2881337 RepID=UPI00299DCF8D|nr:NADPH:quinone reductase [Microvirga lenta]